MIQGVKLDLQKAFDKNGICSMRRDGNNVFADLGTVSRSGSQLHTMEGFMRVTCLYYKYVYPDATRFFWLSKIVTPLTAVMVFYSPLVSVNLR